MQVGVKKTTIFDQHRPLYRKLYKIGP